MTHSNSADMHESLHLGVPYLKHVFYRAALLHCQLRHVEALATVPPHLQLLLGELQQVIQRFIVYLTIRRPVDTWHTSASHAGHLCVSCNIAFCRNSNLIR